MTFSEPGPCRIDRVDADQLETSGIAVPVSDDERARVVVSVGQCAVTTQEVRIVDENDQPLPERRVGEIVVRGPSVMKGYYRRRDASNETLRGGWLHTGDLGYLADRELYIVGRKKDVIILPRSQLLSAGYRVRCRPHRGCPQGWGRCVLH